MVHKILSWTHFWEKEKVAGFTEDAVNAGSVGVVFLLCIDFHAWLQVPVFFCNEKLKEINLLAPCCFITVL